jgi:hypothetical protein
MSEFKFTDAEWRKYQQIPDQGYSHRGHLEFVVNRWLAEHDRQISEKVWNEAIQEAESCGWLHDRARDEMIQRNPYRGETK